MDRGASHMDLQMTKVPLGNADHVKEDAEQSVEGYSVF